MSAKWNSMQRRVEKFNLQNSVDKNVLVLLAKLSMTLEGNWNVLLWFSVRRWRNVARRINHNEQDRTIEDNEREGKIFFSHLSGREGFSLLQFSELAELFTCFQFHYQNLNSHTCPPRRFIQAQENCYFQPFHENNFPAWVVTYWIESEFFVELAIASEISLS